MPSLDVTLTVSAEERPDCWALFVHELGFFAYGATEQAAHNRIESLLSALVASFDSDAEQVRNYLDACSVKYVWLDEAAPDLAETASVSTRLGDLGQITIPEPPTLSPPRLHTFGGVEVTGGVAA